VIGLLWSAPLSIVGLLLAPFFDRRSIHKGVLLCEGARWPARLGWRYRAIALGHVVLCVDDIDEQTLAHEAVHVQQSERWGPLFPLAYGLSSLWALLTGRHHYRDNHFEIQARRISGHS
jgi:hypothetical protein